MNELAYEIRELFEDDIIKIGEHKLTRLLGAPSRFQNTDYKWFYRYIRNYENAIRCCITDKNDCIAGVVLFSAIDFINRNANVFLHIFKETEQEEICRLSLRAILNFAASSLHMKSLILHMCHDYTEAMTNTGFQKMGRFCGEYWYYHNSLEHAFEPEIDVLSAKLPAYCIDAVHISDEKQYVLEYFDKDMYQPISCNPSANRIRSNIIISADMMLAYNQEMLGFIAFYANNSTTRVAYITSIVVNERAQHQGVGRALMERCKSIACMRGMDYILLEVNKNNKKALEFYESLGYIYNGSKSNDTLFFKHLL